MVNYNVGGENIDVINELNRLFIDLGIEPILDDVATVTETEVEYDSSPVAKLDMAVVVHHEGAKIEPMPAKIGEVAVLSAIDPLCDAEGGEKASSIGIYRFPNECRVFMQEVELARGLTDTELRNDFVSLQDVALSGVGYELVRSKWCAYSVVLNERQIMPPVTRIKLNLPKGGRLERGGQKDASNDRQVLDMHWLHCGKFSPHAPRWGKIFAEEFSFSVAGEFVKTMGAGDNKALALGLTRKEMLLLSVLCSETVRKRQSDIRSQSEVRIRLIREALAKPGCRLDCTSEEMVNLCHALQLADQELDQAIKVLRQCYATSVDKQTMGRRKKWLIGGKIIHPVVGKAV